MSWIGQISFCDRVNAVNNLIDAVTERERYFRTIPKDFRRIKFTGEDESSYDRHPSWDIPIRLRRLNNLQAYYDYLWETSRTGSLVSRVLSLFRFAAYPESLGTFEEESFFDNSRAAAFLREHGYDEFVNADNNVILREGRNYLTKKNNGRLLEALYLLVNNIVYPFANPPGYYEQYVERMKDFECPESSFLDKYNKTKYRMDWWWKSGNWLGYRKELNQTVNEYSEDWWRIKEWRIPSVRITIPENDFLRETDVKIYYNGGHAKYIYTGERNQDGKWVSEFHSGDGYPWADSDKYTQDYFEIYPTHNGSVTITPPLIPAEDIATVDNSPIPDPRNIQNGDIQLISVQLMFWWRTRNLTQNEYPPLSYRFLD